MKFSRKKRLKRYGRVKHLCMECGSPEGTHWQVTDQRTGEGVYACPFVRLSDLLAERVL